MPQRGGSGSLSPARALQSSFSYPSGSLPGFSQQSPPSLTSTRLPTLLPATMQSAESSMPPATLPPAPLTCREGFCAQNPSTFEHNWQLKYATEHQTPFHNRRHQKLTRIVAKQQAQEETYPPLQMPNRKLQVQRGWGSRRLLPSPGPGETYGNTPAPAFVSLLFSRLPGRGHKRGQYGEASKGSASN